METQALDPLDALSVVGLYETLKHLSGLTFIVRILPCSSSLQIIVKYVPRWPRLVIKEGVRCEGKSEVMTQVTSCVSEDSEDLDPLRAQSPAEEEAERPACRSQGGAAAELRRL